MSALRIETRLWIAAVALGLTCSATLWVRAGFQFEVAPLAGELATLPLTLDDWRGEEAPQVDQRVLDVLQAQATIDRIYRDREGRTLLLTISAWLDPDTIAEAAPHLPKVCYRNAGWTILEERDVAVGPPDRSIPLIVCLMERGEERIVAAYWYQMGSEYFATTSEARRIHRELWGRPVWPATVKVLMQTAARSIDTGLPLLERFIPALERHLDALIGIAPPTEVVPTRP